MAQSKPRTPPAAQSKPRAPAAAQSKPRAPAAAQSKPRTPPPPPPPVARGQGAAAEATTKEASKAAKAAKVGKVGKEKEAAAVVEEVAAKGKGKAKAKAKPVPAVAPPSDADRKVRREEQGGVGRKEEARRGEQAAMRAPRAPRPPPAARPLEVAPQAVRGRSPRATGWWEKLPWEEAEAWAEAGATGQVRAAMTGGKAEGRMVGLAAGTWAQPGDTADAWARRVLHRARRADAAPHVILASGAADAQAIDAGIRRL